MADVTVAQFAEVLKVPVERLLAQLDQAGIAVESADATISDEAKMELLTHLRRSHGHGAESGASPRKITLKRKSQSELKLASVQGRARTVSVEVRRQRTYIKRDVLEEKARLQQEELDRKREVANAWKLRASGVSPKTRCARRQKKTRSAWPRRALAKRRRICGVLRKPHSAPCSSATTVILATVVSNCMSRPM